MDVLIIPRDFSDDASYGELLAYRKRPDVVEVRNTKKLEAIRKLTARKPHNSVVYVGSISFDNRDIILEAYGEFFDRGVRLLGKMVGLEGSLVYITSFDPPVFVGASTEH